PDRGGARLHGRDHAHRSRTLMAETRDPRRFLLMFAVGIGLMAVLVSGILFMQRGARIGLTGKFLKVRTAALDENSTVVVVDFRVNNPSDVPFAVPPASL